MGRKEIRIGLKRDKDRPEKGIAQERDGHWLERDMNRIGKRRGLPAGKNLNNIGTVGPERDRNRAEKLLGIGQERDKETGRKMMRNMTRRRQE